MTPLYSLMPAALYGAKPAFRTTYGAPNAANARAILAAAGITAPVALDAWYTPTHYGPEEDADLGEIRRQLEASGLFTVKRRPPLKSTAKTYTQPCIATGA